MSEAATQSPAANDPVPAVRGEGRRGGPSRFMTRLVDSRELTLAVFVIRRRWRAVS